VLRYGGEMVTASVLPAGQQSVDVDVPGLDALDATALTVRSWDDGGRPVLLDWTRRSPEPPPTRAEKTARALLPGLVDQADPPERGARLIAHRRTVSLPSGPDGRIGGRRVAVYGGVDALLADRRRRLGAPASVGPGAPSP
jgi:hypothetical protein